MDIRARSMSTVKRLARTNIPGMSRGLDRMSKMNRGIGSVPTNKLSRLLLAAATGLVVALPTTTSAQDRQSADERAAELERTYVVGPKKARQLQCRINWQTTVDLRGGQTLGMEVDAQNVYTVAMGNRLTRLDRKDGKTIWTNTVADLNQQSATRLANLTDQNAPR